jgi:DNA-binding transcriptional LysR family regulator
MFKLNQLHYFVSTVSAGSVTSAAKTLYISQPALSKQLSLLERELNCELFQRKTTGLELTEAGKFFYDRAGDILNQAEILMREMETFTQRTTIKIGALPSIGSYFLPSVISKISNEYKVELSIKDTTSDLIKLLENNQIDVALVQDTSEQKGINVEHLFWEPYDAVVPSSAGNEQNITFQTFLENNIILHKHPCDIRRYFEDYSKENDLNFTVSMDLESNESIIPFVESELGFSIVPRMVSRKVKGSSIKIKTLEEEKFKRSIDFLYKPMGKLIGKKILAYSRESILEDEKYDYT